MLEKIYKSKYLLLLSKIIKLLESEKVKIPFITLLFFISSMLDVVGLSIIGWYITIILEHNISDYFFLNFFFNFFGMTTRNNLIVFCGIFLFLIFFLKAFFGIFITFTIAKFVQNRIHNMRTALMNSFMNMNYLEYVNRHSSEYITSIASSLGRYALVLENSIRLTSDGITTIAIFVFLLLLNPVLFIFLSIIIFLSLLVYFKFYMKKLKFLGEQSLSSQKNMIRALTEGIEGLKELRVLGKIQYFIDRVKKNSNIISKNETTLRVISIAPRFMLELVFIIFIVLIILFSLLQEQGLNVMIPTIGIFAFACMRVLPMVYQAINSISMIRFCSEAVNNLYDDFFNNKDNEINNSKISDFKESFESLKLENVYFSYPNSNQKILDNISLTINKNESLAVVGPSGTGKTTLMDVILGLLNIKEGKIFFNNRLIDNNFNFFRSQVGYLPQQAFLINSSIAENVGLGIGKDRLDRKKVENCLKMASLDDFIFNLPDGIDTIIGERGMKLSGGQRQRISLARAFYNDRNVIVLDESTSSLDVDTEKKIVEEIKKLKDKTLIVIAHRESTVINCNKIIQLDKGKIKLKSKSDLN